MASKKKHQEDPKSYEIEKTSLEGSKVKLNVKVPKPVVQGAVKSVQKEILKYVKIPGFRRDKTPLALVKRQVGAEQFHKYVQSQLLPKSYYDALEQIEVEPISEVEYGNVEISNDAFTFEANFSVAPEFRLGDYKSLDVKVAPVEPVTEQAIDDFLTQLAMKSSEKKEAQDGEEIQDGDSVNLLIKGKIDGADCRALRHYNVEVVLGSEELYPGLDEHVRGAKKLDRLNFDLGFAADFSNKTLAGKTAQMEVKVLAHNKVQKQELNDEFASKCGPFKTLADLREGVSKELEVKNQQQAKEELRKQIQESLEALVECDVPEQLVGELTDAKIEDLEHELSVKQVTMADHLESEGKTEDQLRADLNVDSIRALKLSFALAHIARTEGMEVEDREIAARVSMTAHYLRKPFEEILEYVESLGRRPLIRAEILQEKGLEFLVEHYSPVDKSANVNEA